MEIDPHEVDPHWLMDPLDETEEMVPEWVPVWSIDAETGEVVHDEPPEAFVAWLVEEGIGKQKEAFEDGSDMVAERRPRHDEVLTLRSYIDAHPDGWYLHTLIGLFFRADEFLRLLPVEHLDAPLEVGVAAGGLHHRLHIHDVEPAEISYFWHDPRLRAPSRSERGVVEDFGVEGPPTVGELILLGRAIDERLHPETVEQAVRALSDDA